MSATINFPTSLDDSTSMPDPTQYDQIDATSTRHDEVETRQNNAIKALEAKVGIDSSAVTSSLDYRVRQLEGSVGSGTGNSAGTGSPEGVVTRSPGAFYLDTSTENLWYKLTGSGNTGWRQLIG